MNTWGAALTSSPPSYAGNEKGAISPFRLSPMTSQAMSLILSSQLIATPDAFSHLFIYG